jgi:cell division protein FtsB
MNVDTGIWGKLTRVVVFLLAVAFLLVVAAAHVPLIKRNERMRKEVLRLDTRIEREQEERKQLKSAVETLSNDPKAVERLAREQLGYAKPGETVIRFEAPLTNPPAER